MIRTAANAIDLTRGRKVIQIKPGDDFDFSEAEIAMLAARAPRALRALPGDSQPAAFNPWSAPPVAPPE